MHGYEDDFTVTPIATKPFEKCSNYCGVLLSQLDNNSVGYTSESGIFVVK